MIYLKSEAFFELENRVTMLGAKWNDLEEYIVAD
jgi:hypothetical protein